MNARQRRRVRRELGGFDPLPNPLPHLYPHQRAMLKALRQSDPGALVILPGRRNGIATMMRAADLCRRGKPLPPGVAPGQPVNEQGNYYAADGTLMNADGTRSIFDDVDE